MAVHRVLFVEDDQEQANLTLELLSRSNEGEFQVVHVQTMADAVREAKANESFDVVLLDLGLPDTEGVNTVRKMTQATDLPIVVLTGNEDEHVRDESIEYGAIDFLPKDRAKSTDLMAKALRFAIERKQLENKLNESRRRELKEKAKAEEIAARLAYLKLGSDDAPGNVTQEELADFSSQYRDLILAHVRSAQSGRMRPAAMVEQLATELVKKGVGARDLGQLHIEVVDAFRRRMSHHAFREFTREARLTLVDLMGHVLDAYRR